MSIYNQSNRRLSPEFVLLGLLFHLPNYGYILHKRLISDFGYIWHSSQSQTYNILKRLEAQGDIFSSSMKQEKLPARRLLQITETGSGRFTTWLNTPTQCSVHAIRVEFITRSYFMQLYYPQNTGAMIRHQIDVVNTGLTTLQEKLATISHEQIFNRLALELRINLLNSVSGWLEECEQAYGDKNAMGVDDE